MAIAHPVSKALGNSGTVSKRWIASRWRSRTLALCTLPPIQTFPIYPEPWVSFITEGAIPFAANDPLRVIPACIAGSAVTGALSMAFGNTLRAPHGGVFVLAIPNAVENAGLYVVAIAAGTWSQL